MYIERELEQTIKQTFSDNTAKGLILTGIVGGGKTTIIERENFKNRRVFRIRAIHAPRKFFS